MHLRRSFACMLFSLGMGFRVVVVMASIHKHRLGHEATVMHKAHLLAQALLTTSF